MTHIGLSRIFSKFPALSISLSILLSMLLGTSLVFADSFTGRIVGIHCAKAGQLCPYDGLDKHLDDESDFVLMAAKGKYYLLEHITRDVLVRYVLKQVIIEGEVNTTLSTIAVDKLMVQSDSGLSRYTNVWEK